MVSLSRNIISRVIEVLCVTKSARPILRITASILLFGRHLHGCSPRPYTLIVHAFCTILWPANIPGYIWYIGLVKYIISFDSLIHHPPPSSVPHSSSPTRSSSPIPKPLETNDKATTAVVKPYQFLMSEIEGFRYRVMVRELSTF